MKRKAPKKPATSTSKVTIASLQAEMDKCSRKLKKEEEAHARTRTQVRCLEVQLKCAEDGLKMVVALAPKISSSANQPRDWYVGVDAVGRAQEGLRSLDWLRQHRSEVPLTD